MSFILDALRKSENERQRNRTPGIADMRHANTPPSRSIWLPLAALLAGLNIALLGLLWYSSESNNPAQAPAALPELPAQPVAPDSNTRNLSAELASEESGPLDPARFAAIAPPGEPLQPAAADIEIPPAPPPPPPASATRIPTVREAVLDGSLNVRPLHLDLHVYSDTPQERFVFINTARYSEGDHTSEGPTVRAINPDGVILSYQGREYLLTRE